MNSVYKICLVLFLLTSCINTKPNYTVVSVAEEGSLRLTQYTNEQENVVHPSIEKNSSGDLTWYAPALLAVSPQNDKIAYIGLANNHRNLYIKDVKGGKATVQRTFNRDISDMSYSPDGKKICFTERKEEDENIYMISANEGVAVQQLVSSKSPELCPVFSEDGKSVFFVRTEGDRYFIWSLNINSSLLTQYTEGFTPTIFDDGNKVLLTRNKKSKGEIWTVDLNRGIETLILSDPEIGYSSPRISPDGKRVVCVGSTQKNKTNPANLDLYLVNLDGSQITQLTFHGGHDVSPVWSPDGKTLFFLSQRGNKEGIWNVWKMENLIGQ